MKIVTLALILITTITQGQITKGNWLVGGTGSFQNSKSKGNDVINATISGIYLYPNIGKFIINNFAIGLKPSLRSETSKYLQSNGTTSNTKQTFLGIGPFVRYYFLNPDKQINIFSEGSLGYTLLKVSNQNADKYKSVEKIISIGSSIFFNSSVAFEVSLSYSSSKSLDIDSRYNGLKIGLGFQIHLERDK